MIRKLFNLIFRKRSVKSDVQNICLPVFHIAKHYNDMNRKERREYKKWLAKNNMWDGAMVIDNLQKNKLLSIRD